MANDKFTAQQIIDAAHATKGMVTLTARRLNCSVNTVKRYIKSHATVREAFDEEREAVTDTAELALFNAITNGEAWAVCFYLKTQGKGRGYVERQEVTGKDGGAVEIDVADKLLQLISNRQINATDERA